MWKCAARETISSRCDLRAALPAPVAAGHCVPCCCAAWQSVEDQARFRYIVYVEGHVPGASSRYTCLLRSGSVILKVAASTDKSFDMWYMPLLVPWVDHVPVAADLSDLAERIQWCRQHDLECRAIVAAARRVYDSFASRDAILDYNALLLSRIAERCVLLPGDRDTSLDDALERCEEDVSDVSFEVTRALPLSGEQQDMVAEGIPLSFGAPRRTLGPSRRRRGDRRHHDATDDGDGEARGDRAPGQRHDGEALDASDGRPAKRHHP